MGNDTGPKDDDIVEFILRLPREARHRLHKWSKKHQRSANSQLIHVINKEEPRDPKV